MPLQAQRATAHLLQLYVDQKRSDKLAFMGDLLQLNIGTVVLAALT